MKHANPMFEKSLRSLLVLTVCAVFGLPAWGAIELEERVAYLQDVQPGDQACAWEAGMVSAVVAGSNGGIVRADKAAVPTSTRLSMEVARLSMTGKGGKGEYGAVVRGNIVRNGKLLATRDFQGSESFKNEQTQCKALLELSTLFGNAASEWASNTSLMECQGDCAGIHPDEAIVVGTEVLGLGVPDAINDTVRDECRWPTAMISRLLKAYNESDEPLPRAKLESRPIDIEKYAGRRLVLRVKEIHALGGGGWSGPKWMAMSGELRDGPALVASFDSYSTSGRGITTCRSVDSLSDSTTEMIVKWLLSPSLGAQLR